MCSFDFISVVSARGAETGVQVRSKAKLVSFPFLIIASVSDVTGSSAHNWEGDLYGHIRKSCTFLNELC